MLVFLYLGNAESESFNINQSFLVLFMVIIGGLGSLLGSFLGAALIYGLPIVLRMLKEASGLAITSANVEHFNFILLGSLIIFFLIVEPNGLARLWQIGKQKLRVWPFPY
jgi:branched-chain amino acid transport system permease protein